MHTWTDEGHFYSPLPPTSGDKNIDKNSAEGYVMPEKDHYNGA